MRNFKKVVAMTLIAASTASLAACGNSGSSKGNKITLAWWGGDTRHNATKAAVDKWKAKNPGFEVELQYNSWDGYEDKMATKFASNTQADINQINWGWLNSYDKTDKLFMDLKDSKLNNKLDLSQFDEAYLNQCKINDKVVAVPVSITGRIFYWNKTTFDKAGIKTPTTYKELLEAGDKFKSTLGDEYYPLAMNQLDRMILMVNFLESKYNVEWVTDNKLNYSEAQIKEGFDFIKELEDRHVIPTIKKLNGDAASSLDKNNNWITGKYAGIFEWDSSAVKFKGALDKKSNFEFVVGDEIKFFENKGGYTKISLAFAISKNTKYPEQCADLVNFLLNEEEGVKEMSLERGTPLSKKAQDILTKAGKLEGDMVTAANKKVMQNSPFKMDPTFEDQKLKGTTGAYFTTLEAASYGTKTNEEAAKDLYTAINEVLEANK